MKKLWSIGVFVVVSILVSCFAGATLAQAVPVTVNDVLGFFDTAVLTETLAGQGGNPGVQKATLKIERELLSKANKHFDKGRMELGCASLHLAYEGCNGEDMDLVVGDATPELSAMINSAGWGYGCLWIEGLDVEIEFFNTQGSAIADSTGMTFYIEYPRPSVQHDPTLVYPPEYWREYPLYLPGWYVVPGVSVTYLGPQEVATYTLVAEYYKIELDGTNGALVHRKQTGELTFNKGETVEWQPTYVLPDEAKGLLRLIMSVYNEGSLIVTKEAIFCPPDLESLE